MVGRKLTIQASLWPSEHKEHRSLDNATMTSGGTGAAEEERKVTLTRFLLANTNPRPNCSTGLAICIPLNRKLHAGPEV